MIEGQEGVSWSQWLDLARACERHGIPAMFRSDHYMNLDGTYPERAALDAWGTINALAATTSTLRLGTMVSPASFRHPSVLAKLVVTADHVSGGRVELGLGAGWHRHEHEAYGFPFAPTGVRMDVLAEQLEVITGAWREGPFSFHGEHYELHELDAQPKPIQHPRPPLIIGGDAGPRSSALAARFADEYNTTFPTIDDVRRRKAAVDRACEEAGRDSLAFSIMTAVVLGTDEHDLRVRLDRLAEKMGSAPGSLSAEDPPAGWIVGTLERARERLGELERAGVGRVMCQHLVHEDLDALALIGSIWPAR
ncbi:MAG TPA: TIGR03560 family F420-dependent LLM class oxidoreductase [Solirubrobacteraceae bacterium]